MKVVELQRGYYQVGKRDTVLAMRDGLRCWNCNRRACKHSAAVLRFLTPRAADASPDGFEDEYFDSLLDGDIDGK